MGLEVVLNLQLVKYAAPGFYREFFDDLLNRSTKTTIAVTSQLRVPEANSRPLCDATNFSTGRSIYVSVYFLSESPPVFLPLVCVLILCPSDRWVYFLLATDFYLSSGI